MNIRNNKKLIKETIGKLEIIFNNSILSSHLNEDTFKDIVLKQISILNFIEKKSKISKPQASEYLKQLNQKTNSSFNFQDLSYKNESDVEDDLSYLDVYIKNIYKKDIKEFLNEGDSTKGSKKDEPKKVEYSRRIDPNEKTNTNNQNGFPGMNPQQQAAFYQEQVYIQMAREKLGKEIMDGTFYKYSSKPKVIIYLKRALSGLSIALALMSVIQLVFYFLWAGIPYFLPNNNVQEPHTDKVNAFNVITQIIYIGVFVYVAFLLIRPTKNENNLYGFNTFIGVIVLVFLIFYIMDGVLSIRMRFDFQLADPNNQHHVSISDGIKIGYFVQIGIYAAIFFVTLLCVVFRPKVDNERIERKMLSLIDEIKQQVMHPGQPN